jgi:hypothetical protein
MAVDQPRRRRPLDDIPHKRASDVRVVDVPAQHGIVAHKNYLVTTACGQEITTTLVSLDDERVRCAACKAAIASPADPTAGGERR